MGRAFSACLRSAFRQPFNCIAALLHCKLIKFIQVECFGVVLKQKPAPDNHVAFSPSSPEVLEPPAAVV